VYLDYLNKIHHYDLLFFSVVSKVLFKAFDGIFNARF